MNKPLYCQACGSQNPSQSKFCNMCGVGIAPAGSPGGALVPSKSKTSSSKRSSSSQSESEENVGKRERTTSQMRALRKGDRSRLHEVDADDPERGQPKSGQPKLGQPKSGQPKLGQPKSGQPKLGQPKLGQPESVDVWAFQNESPRISHSLTNFTLDAAGVPMRRIGWPHLLTLAAAMLLIGGTAVFFLDGHDEAQPDASSNVPHGPPPTLEEEPVTISVPEVVRHDAVQKIAPATNADVNSVPGFSHVVPPSRRQPSAAPRAQAEAATTNSANTNSANTNSANTNSAGTPRATSGTIVQSGPNAGDTRREPTNPQPSDGTQTLVIPPREGTTGSTAPANIASPTNAGAPNANGLGGNEPESDERDLEMDMYTGNLRRVIRTYYAARASSCFERASLRTQEAVRGTVTIGFDVPESGMPQNVHVVRNSTSKPELGECLVMEVRQWRLPVPPSPPLPLELPFSR